jgi:hypothetical protein
LLLLPSSTANKKPFVPTKKAVQSPKSACTNSSNAAEQLAQGTGMS